MMQRGNPSCGTRSCRQIRSLPCRSLRIPQLFLFLLLLLGLPLRPGEVRTEHAAPVVDLVVHNWVLPDATRSDPMSRANLAVVRAFQEAYPGIVRERYAERYRANPQRYGDHDWDRIQVRPRKFTGIRVEGVESDLMAIAGGIAPDVMYLNFRRSDSYIRNGFLAPLDPYLSELPPGEFEERVHEKILPVIRRQGTDGQVHTWAMPYGGLMGKGLLFRKDRFDEAGLSYPDESWDWEDLLHAARVLSDPGKGRYGLRLARGSHESYHFTSFLWSAGAEFMTWHPDRNEWTLDYDSPEAARALDFYVKLITEAWTDAEGKARRGYAYRDSSGAWAKWQNGDIAMTQGYMDEQMFNVINPELTGLAPIPMGPDGLRGSEINSRMLALFSDIQDPVVQDAAWEFIRFFSSHEADAIRTRILVRSGLAPFVHPDQLRAHGYHALVKLSPPEWTQIFKLAVEHGKPEPYGPNSNIAYEQLSQPLQQAVQLGLNDELPENHIKREQLLQQLLHRSALRARVLMLGEEPTESRNLRRGVSSLVLIILALAYAFLIRTIVKVYARAAAAQGQVGRSRRRFWVCILLAPAIITVTLWQVYPLLQGSLMAFQEVQLLGDSRWSGLENFSEVLFDQEWWSSLWAATRYSAWVMLLTFIPPFLLAVLLQETPWGQLFFRVMFYLPAVVNGLIMILLWKWFYEESEYGLLNNLVMRVPALLHLLTAVLSLSLGFLFCRRLLRQDAWKAAGFSVLAAFAAASCAWGLAQDIWAQHDSPTLFSRLQEPIAWLSNPETAMFACVLPLAWAGMGPGCLVYLAALKGIDEESYEAAELDGASFLDKLLFIVVPRIRPLLIINFLGVFLAAFFHAEANILAMTGGAAQTRVAGLYIFQQAYIFLRFGAATAMAWLLGLLLMGFTLWQLRILVRLEFRNTNS